MDTRSCESLVNVLKRRLSASGVSLWRVDMTQGDDELFLYFIIGVGQSARKVDKMVAGLLSSDSHIFGPGSQTTLVLTGPDRGYCSITMPGLHRWWSHKGEPLEFD